ncbi:MAG: hypothetical protein E7381_04915 [Clostridiales bacterium]|nr:hypothetical protein [Clostridiales bacterium]
MEGAVLKIDTHLHSSAISVCSRVNYKQLIDKKIAQGYDGGVLTNHCDSLYYEEADHDAFMRKFVAEFERAEAYATQKGFLLWLGLEVTLHNPWYAHWLVFGATKELLLTSPCFHALKQSELFEYCQKNGLTLVQAHPYRYGGKPIAPAFTHGLEINCSDGDLQRAEEIVAVAKTNGLLVTCGTDYHGLNKFVGGMCVPDWVKTGAEFNKYLRQTEETTVFLEDKVLRLPAFPPKK